MYFNEFLEENLLTENRYYLTGVLNKKIEESLCFIILLIFCHIGLGLFIFNDERRIFLTFIMHSIPLGPLTVTIATRNKHNISPTCLPILTSKLFPYTTILVFHQFKKNIINYILVSQSYKI